MSNGGPQPDPMYSFVVKGGVQLGLTSIYIAITLTFTTLHVLAHFNQERDVTAGLPKDKLKTLRNSIIQFNFGSILFVWPSLITHSIMPSTEDETECQILFGLAIQCGLYANFLLYRLLLARADLVLVQTRHGKQLMKYAWRLVHYIQVPNLLFATVLQIIIPGIFHAEVYIMNGKSVCGLVIPPHDKLIPIVAILVALLDFIVSVTCLGLFVYGIFSTMQNKNRNHVVQRFLLWTSIAISSTLGYFGVILYYVFSHTIAVVQTGLMLSTVDLLINVVSVNMTWPVMYYTNALRKLSSFCFPTRSRRTEETETKAFSHNNNDDKKNIDLTELKKGAVQGDLIRITTCSPLPSSCSATPR